MGYLKFIKQNDKLYIIINTNNEELGTIEYYRVGQWYSWCLCLYQNSYMSASCLDEVRQKIKELNSKK